MSEKINVTKENRSDNVEQKKSPATNRADLFACEAVNFLKQVCEFLPTNIKPHKFNCNNFVRFYV